MAKVRKGRQTPTESVVLPYRKTKGGKAAELYAKCGRELMKWQKLILNDILAYKQNKEELWIHSQFGYEIPRRNGKGEVLIALEMLGLQEGKRILHTAHRTTTSHSAWERLYDALTQAGYMFSSYKAYGLESIRLESTGGVINFRTRSSSGGLGEGYDLLVIDEAQEYTDAQASALKYVVSASKNGQTIYCGTPPTAASAGTVFMKMRERALAGEAELTGWAEWSVKTLTAVDDREAWYETNPALGTTLTERAIVAETDSDELDFNIQRLGLWLKYNQKSAITEVEWEKLLVNNLPKLSGQLHVGIKFAHEGGTVAMAIAVKTAEGKVFVEAIDVRPVSAGYDWMLNMLSLMDLREVVIDGASGQQAMSEAMKELALKAPVIPSVKDIIMAGSDFEQAIFAEKIQRMEQPSLSQAATNCIHRAIGSNGGYGYKAILEGTDIALLEAVVLAHWSCARAKEPKKQVIQY